MKTRFLLSLILLSMAVSAQPFEKTYPLMTYGFEDDIQTTKKATLRVTTIDGRMVYECPLISFDNEKVIRINNLPDAVYIAELIANGKRISNTKLTIVH